MRVCSISGCPTIYPRSEGAKCAAHRKEADTARGTATQRGYNTRGHHTFRDAILARDPYCQICQVEPSTVADHWPKSRRELVQLGLDPNAASAGRGLCHRCHSIATAANPDQRGGWNV